MTATEVKIYGGVAQMIKEIQGRTYSFTGAWNLIVDDDEGRSFAFECLVPGEANSLSGLAGAMGDWATNDYAVGVEAYDDEGDLTVTQEMVQELKMVLEQVNRREIQPVNVYGGIVPEDYVQRVLAFILPRLDFIPKNLEGGIATRHDIELSMRPTDIPVLPKA